MSEKAPVPMMKFADAAFAGRCDRKKFSLSIYVSFSSFVPPCLMEDIRAIVVGTKNQFPIEFAA